MKQVINAIKDFCVYNYETIAVAEHATSGCVQMLLSSVPQAETYFQGGVSTTHNEQLGSLLGVESVGYEHKNNLNLSLSIDTAKAVAKKFNSDIGIAIVGCPHPYGQLHCSYATIVRFNKVVYAGKFTSRAIANKLPIEYAQQIIQILADKLLPNQEELLYTTSEILEPLS